MSEEQGMIRYDRVRHISVYISRIRYFNEHVHGSFELDYVLEGCATYRNGEDTKNVKPGDLILTNPFEPHSYASIENKPFILLTVQIHKLYARRYIEDIPNLLFNTAQMDTLTLQQREELKTLLFQIAMAYCDNRDSYQFDVMGYVSLLLGRLVSWLDWHLEEKTDNVDKALQKSRVRRLVSYIDENYRQKITLTKLAEMEGISTTYLSHFFKKAFGVTFQSYLSSQRFEKALLLMHDKNISMVDICMNCGFSDSRYLEAACRKHFGCSVAEYRRRCEDQIEGEIILADNVLYKKCSRKESLNFLKSYLGEEKFLALS